MSEAPEIIKKLVNKFDHNLAAYKSSDYKEEQLKQEFINPFFKALGWDVDNESDAAPQYRDVIFEDSIKVGGGTKAPDYCFTLAGRRMFFVEAKKPSVNINEGIEPSYQLRRYAWSAKLYLSILTDFEELAIYESRTKPKKNDRASTGRITYLTYKDYVEKWDEIYNIFSKEAVLKGSFDLYAESTKKKRGTSAVDDAFLSEIENWRELFAKNIALRNPEISIEELNYSVQQIIDRIVFLRMCEDRGAEKYEQIRDLLNNDNIYAQFCELCKRADEKYNSGLFHFKEEKGRETSVDNLTLDLKIDDGIFKTIIKNLYYPNSPYEFSVLSPEILGNVYEQFLGKVIRLTKGHQAKVEEKPEVKKSGGVYYTPQFIVDYIVEDTVGKLLKGKTPNKVSDLKILDPACGSGSFLLGAYNYLMKWHRDYYSNQKENKRLKDKIYKGKGGEWILTIKEKKRILLNNIYGVDIDNQAVEVTKLSLLLKVIEGENKDALEAQKKLFRERALPDLENNIKCGNSLIGSEIYDNGELSETEIQHINAFDWDDNFPEIMDKGGFDAVIGNPPYIRIQAMNEWAPVEVDFYKKTYNSASKGNYDIYVVFVEKGLNLLNNKGLLGFILPHKFFKAKYGQPLRSLLNNGQNLDKVVHFGDHQIFEKATTYTCLIFLNNSPKKKFNFIKVVDLDSWINSKDSIEGEISFEKVAEDEWNFIVGPGAELFEKLGNMPVKLGNISKRIFQGIIPGADKVYALELISKDDNKAFCYSRALDKKVYLELSILRKIVSGKDVKQFTFVESDERVIYPYKTAGDKAVLIPPKELKENYPLTYEYFEKTREILNKRDRGSAKGNDWYKYIRSQNIGLQHFPKLAVPRLVNHLQANYDSEGAYCLDNVDVGGIILPDDTNLTYSYLLGLLNSKLLNFYFIRNTVLFRGGFFSANKQYIEKLPIQTLNFEDPTDISIHDKMTKLVDKMILLNKNISIIKTPNEKKLLKSRIDATYKQIDRMVYDLYGLTPEEIKIIEDSFI